jgi:hypothetical protein
MNVIGQLQAATFFKAEGKKDRQCTYNITLRRVYKTTVAVEKQ